MNAVEWRSFGIALILLVIGICARILPDTFCAGCGDFALVQGTVPEGRSLGFAIDSTEPTPRQVQEATTGISKSKAKRKVASLGKSSIRVNQATLVELQAIKGVGPVLAQRIIETRDRIGGFRGPSDLDKVPGIGKKKLDNLLLFLIFD